MSIREIDETEFERVNRVANNGGPRKDDKGRVLVHDMSEREIMEELLLTVRALGDAFSEMGKNPMLKAFAGKMFQ